MHVCQWKGQRTQKNMLYKYIATFYKYRRFHFSYRSISSHSGSVVSSISWVRTRLFSHRCKFLQNTANTGDTCQGKRCFPLTLCDCFSVWMYTTSLEICSIHILAWTFRLNLEKAPVFWQWIHLLFSHMSALSLSVLLFVWLWSDDVKGWSHSCAAAVYFVDFPYCVIHHKTAARLNKYSYI